MPVNKYGRFYCKIVITGGPCSGKTTAIAEIKKRLECDNAFSDVWKIFTVVEAASFLYKGNIQRSEMNDKQIKQWQMDIILSMFKLEDVYENIAKYEVMFMIRGLRLIRKDKNVIIICDRGGFDVKIFTKNKDQWNQILSEVGFSEKIILQRYDHVIQLETAPKDFYTKTNNVVRRETYEEANQMNVEYQKVWMKHKCFKQFKSEDSWEDKIEKILAFFLEIISKN